MKKELGFLKKLGKHLLGFFWNNKDLFIQPFFANGSPQVQCYFTGNVFYSDKGRYLYSYVLPLIQRECTKNGYTVEYGIILNFKYSLIQSIKKTDLTYRNKFIKNAIFVGFRVKRMPENSNVTLFTDNENIRNKYRDKKGIKIIFINYNRNHLKSNYQLLPYVSHPKFFKTIFTPKKENRVCLVVFMGNQSESYNNKRFNSKYDIPNRFQTIQYLKENIQIKFFKTKFDFFNLPSNQTGIDIRINSNDSRIETEDYIEILNNSNFFLCLPGMGFPMAHNAIESMFNGCIPILAYHDWFCPRLEDRNNCLIYSTNEDLVEVLSFVSLLSSDEIETMRTNVLLYAQEHLTLEKIDLSPESTLLLPFTYGYPEKEDFIA